MRVTPEQPPVVVALINSSPDVVDMLRIAFEHAGFVVVSTFTHAVRDGDVDLDSFLRLHRPDVIIYDIAPPYQSNWQLFLHLRRLPGFENRPVIITSTNPARVRPLADAAEPIFEVVETPYELSLLLETATRAAGREFSKPN